MFAARAGAHLETDRLPDPGQPGSHEEYLERLQGARESEYARLLARYDAHVAAHPADVIAAIERCRFVESAESEAEPQAPGACGAELAERFPDDPEVLLFRAEALEPDDTLSLERQLGRAEGWTAAQRARLLERVALALFERGRVDEAFDRARRAVAIDPGLALGRVLAEGWLRRREPGRAVQALVSDVDRIPSWEFAPRAERLVELGAHEHALAVIAAAQERADAWIDPVLHGRALEGVGRREEARARYQEAADAPWFREQALRRLFELALAGGSASEAQRAYLALRDGERGDALARRRLALARAFPGTPWDARDLRALGALAGTLLALAAAPLLWVLPLHYLGLRRGRGDAPDLDGERRWGASHLWYAGAVLGLIHFTCLYVFLYADLERWLGSGDGSTARDPAALASYGLAVGTLCAVGALLPLRRGDWQRAFACRWGPLRTLATCAVALMLVRLTALVCVNLGDAPVPPGAATLTEEVLSALADRWGAIALVAYAVLLIPLCEELLFRGMMLGAASRFVGFGAASLFQALLFALLHDSLALAPFYVVVGLVCAELRRSSGGLRAPLLVHAGNNAIAISALF